MVDCKSAGHDDGDDDNENNDEHLYCCELQFAANNKVYRRVANCNLKAKQIR